MHVDACRPPPSVSSARPKISLGPGRGTTRASRKRATACSESRVPSRRASSRSSRRRMDSRWRTPSTRLGPRTSGRSERRSGSDSDEAGAVRGAVLDSTLFVDLARRRPSAIREPEEWGSRNEIKVIPTPVAHEVLAGIFRSRSRTQASLFRGWARRFQIAPLDFASAEKAAQIRAELSALGRSKGTGDVLTAGIALAGNHSRVTRDADFHEISRAIGLVVELYGRRTTGRPMDGRGVAHRLRLSVSAQPMYTGRG